MIDVVWLGGAAFAAGLVDAVVGGGGLIQIPAMFSRRPVLLLHGFPDTHAIWRHQIPALAGAGMRVIAPDLRGYGRTDAPTDPGAYAINFLADDVLRLMDALGIEKASLVGHDWGGLIGWHLAMHAPDRIERYAALSTGHPAAIAKSGFSQYLRLWYVLVFKPPAWPSGCCAPTIGMHCGR